MLLLSLFQELLYNRMWICRQLFCVIAVLVLLICAYRYKDLAHMNYQLLLDIKKQNSELRHQLGKMCVTVSHFILQS